MDTMVITTVFHFTSSVRVTSACPAALALDATLARLKTRRGQASAEYVQQEPIRLIMQRCVQSARRAPSTRLWRQASASPVVKIGPRCRPAQRALMRVFVTLVSTTHRLALLRASCEPGTWNEHLNQSACSNCSAGTYNENTASHTEEHCTVCPPGSYCLEGAGSPEKCPEDTPHSAQGSTRIEDCCAAGSAVQYYTNLSESCAFSICSSGTEVRSWQSAEAAYNESFCLQCLTGMATHGGVEADGYKVVSWYPQNNAVMFNRANVISWDCTPGTSIVMGA